MADAKKQVKKQTKEDERKVNPWIPAAVVIFIVALVGIMAIMSGGTDNSAAPSDTQAASGTTQSGTTETAAPEADVSWITLEMTPNEIAEKAGIPPKMLMQVIAVDEASMAKPVKDIGGEEVLETIKGLVGQFGSGMTSGSGTSGMGQ